MCLCDPLKLNRVLDIVCLVRIQWSELLDDLRDSFVVDLHKYLLHSKPNARVDLRDTRYVSASGSAPLLF